MREHDKNSGTFISTCDQEKVLDRIFPLFVYQNVNVCLRQYVLVLMSVNPISTAYRTLLASLSIHS